MSVVILDEEIVHYEVLGRGRPVIFLHGWIGSWRYWISSMQAASMFFRAYALDLFGFGDTVKNPQKYNLCSQVELLDSFLEKLGIAKCAVVGHGLGAAVALSYARQKPGTVDRVLAVSSPSEPGSINPRLKNSSTGVLADWLLGKVPGADAARMEAQKADPQAVHTSIGELEKWDITQFPYSPAIPCLFVHGINDPGVSPPLLNGLEGLDDYTHYIFFDQSGHFPMLDENSKFHRLLNDFLALPSGESPQTLQLKEEWKRRVR
jgi:pimeloyl-ACP methyl ester carboxylesterase